MSRLLLICFEPAETIQLAGFAQALGLPYDCLLLTGTEAPKTGWEKAFSAGFLALPDLESLDDSLTEFCRGYSHIASVSSMKAKDGLARTAALLGAAMLTDILEVHSPTTFTRPMVAGSVLAQVEAMASPLVLIVRPTSFPKVEASGSAEAERVSLSEKPMARIIKPSAKSSGGRPDLSQAKVVVSGGRPLGDSGTFERVIGGLADKLGGAVGATRAAVDNGIAHNELQVGQTGKIVAPDLYIAAGISGSTQHMAGIKDSKTIVAINKDPDAPIFAFADLGIVADLFDVVPELTSKIKG